MDMSKLNEAQKDWLKLFLLENEMTFKEPEWDDIKAVHSKDIVTIYLHLKALE